MNIKITDSRSVSRTDKKKKSSGSKKSGGPSFASMVEKAAGADNVEKSEAARTAFTPVHHDGLYEDDVPKDAKERAGYMLEKLEELEKDILSGEPTMAAHKLKVALETEAINRDDLPPRLKALLDEIDMRASVEIAKLEADND